MKAIQVLWADGRGVAYYEARCCAADFAASASEVVSIREIDEVPSGVKLRRREHVGCQLEAPPRRRHGRLVVYPKSQRQGR